MQILRTLLHTLLLAILVWMAIGCASDRQSALAIDHGQLVEPALTGDFDVVNAEAEAAWQKRLDRAQTELAIEKWEAAVKSQTPSLTAEQRAATIASTYESLSRAYYLLADSHLRLAARDTELDDQMMETFEHGVTAAEKAIALRDPAFATQIAANRRNWIAAIGSAKPEALVALYWYVANLGRWAMIEGIATILAHKDNIRTTMDWILSTDATYYYGAPYRYFGVYFANVPIGAGDPDASLESFQKSIEIAPNYLASKVLMAEHYAVLVGDRDLYERLLNEVVAADTRVLPEIAPENELQKRKAKRMLATSDAFFY